jgi:hypothetical protein
LLCPLLLLSPPWRFLLLLLLLLLLRPRVAPAAVVTLPAPVSAAPRVAAAAAIPATPRVAPFAAAPSAEVAPPCSTVLEGLAATLLKILQRERPGHPTPTLRLVQNRLAQLEPIHGAEVLQKYIEQDAARVCKRTEIVSPVHVFTSRTWFETWVKKSDVLADLRRSDKEQKDLDALVRYAKSLPIEAGLSEGTIRKLLGSLLSRGSLSSVKAYLKNIFHEFRQAHGDFGVSPLQLACDPERAQDGIWAIEKICANQELAAQVAKVFDGEVPMKPMKSVLEDVLKTTPRTPLPTPMASTSPPAPTAPPAPPYTPRGPYQSPGSTPQQVATNAVGARAALEALRGPPAEPTLPSEFFGSSPQDGETKDYRGYRYRFFEAKGFWKRIQVVREFAA